MDVSRCQHDAHPALTEHALDSILSGQDGAGSKVGRARLVHRTVGMRQKRSGRPTSGFASADYQALTNTNTLKKARITARI
jgi:hypothetical protein